MANNNEFNSDLDAILADFNSYSDNLSSGSSGSQNNGTAEKKPQTAQMPKAKPVDTPAAAPAPAAASNKQDKPDSGSNSGSAEYYVDVSRLETLLNSRRSAQAQSEAKKSASPAKQSADAEKKTPSENFSPEFTPSGKSYRRPKNWTAVGADAMRGKDGQKINPDRYLNDGEKRRAKEIQQSSEEKQAKLDAQKSAFRKKDRDAVENQQRIYAARERTQTPIKRILVYVCAVLTLFAICWIGVNVHPDSGTSTASTSQNNLNLTSKLDVYINNAASDALSDVTYIKKIYKIAETDTVAPKPNAAAYGKTTDPAVIQSVIEDAAELLDGQETVWQPDLDFYPNTEMSYYRDSTILVIVWKEIIEERCATLAEVKIADGSQFRRKLSEDTYGSSVQRYASELADAANAVVAANADFYAFRQIGLTVYQRQLFRNDGEKLDTCFITSSGDMLFSRAGELSGDDAVNQYIADNDVVFSLSFGPVLVDNGEVQECSSYPIGEMNLEYSRAGIGMTDELHYLLMTVNHTDNRPRANVNEFARFMASKGCVKAYNLDGGQTSEIVMQGEVVNHVDFGSERTVSDIIYFATAIPESEVVE